MNPGRSLTIGTKSCCTSRLTSRASLVVYVRIAVYMLHLLKASTGRTGTTLRSGREARNFGGPLAGEKTGHLARGRLLQTAAPLGEHDSNGERGSRHWARH